MELDRCLGANTRRSSRLIGATYSARQDSAVFAEGLQRNGLTIPGIDEHRSTVGSLERSNSRYQVMQAKL